MTDKTQRPSYFAEDRSIQRPGMPGGCLNVDQVMLGGMPMARHYGLRDVKLDPIRAAFRVNTQTRASR